MQELTEVRTPQEIGVQWTGRITTVINVPPAEWRKAVDWWTDKLGFEVIHEVPSFPWAELSSPAAGTLFGVQGMEVAPPAEPTLIFQVNDIDGARAALEERGVTFDADTYLIESANCKIATFHDPWKNGVHLEEYL